MGELTGRKEETKIMNSLLSSGKSEFLVVYGRRRVGKTFLIRNAYKGKITFQVTGIGNSGTAQQLTNFNIALNNTDRSENYPLAGSWLEAFQQLITLLSRSGNKKKIVFIDELPWFDTKRSNFIQALEHFWNSWASARNDILLIGCGSASSWIINKLINNRGGLHNRVTKRIRLEPFTLKECEEFLEKKKINLDRYQIVQLYMVIGGIPFYWEEIERGFSAIQNIEKICFSNNGLLRNEFKNLFRSLFNKYEKHEKVVEILANKSIGLTRNEIIKQTGLPNAGSTTRLLNELEESGFIKKYEPFGKKKRNKLYQLNDFYSLFYLKFIQGSLLSNSNNWLGLIDTPRFRAWSGYTFEQVCLQHLPQIKNALGISGVLTNTSSWRSSFVEKGAQIDLIIDRRDHVINLCEMKFSINKFTISKKYAEELRNKADAFKTETKTPKTIFLTLITPFGIKKEAKYSGVVQSNITMDELFV